MGLFAIMPYALRKQKGKDRPLSGIEYPEPLCPTQSLGVLKSRENTLFLGSRSKFTLFYLSGREINYIL